jgi:hypothetical protein
MNRLPVLAALTLLVAAPSMPEPATPPTAAAAARIYRPIETIRWRYGDQNTHQGSSWQLSFEHDRSASTLGPDKSPDLTQVADAIRHTSVGQAVSFTVNREAGSLSCTGRAEAVGRGSGTCRFRPDSHFAAELARRGIAPEDSDDMLGLTLVDARLASVDGLVEQGYRFERADDLIAVAALGVSPSYAGELRTAGLEVAELDDLVAARALRVDAAWLGQMARAGYPKLKVEQAIQMRALGVTPDYAMKMSRVLRTVGEIE